MAQQPAITSDSPDTSPEVDGAAAKLAREIKRRRHEAGMSQSKLAQKIGYTRQYVSSAERVGENLPSREIVQALDTALEADGVLVALRGQAKAAQRTQRRTLAHVAAVRPDPTMTRATSVLGDETTYPSTEIPRRSPLARHRANATLPTYEEISMAADESAKFASWSAITNVDDEILEQMDSDVADLATRYLTETPAAIFSQIMASRSRVFDMLTQKQPPRLTIHLYKVAGQLSGLLAHVSADLGYGHAANTHARTALRCADLAEYPQLVGYIRWIQSNVAYWEGRFDDAAGLIESSIRSVPQSGTGRLRLVSQLARIEASRKRVGDMHAALALTEMSSDSSGDEVGVFEFTSGKAAYYAAEAYRALGDSVSLDASIRYAELSVSELSSRPGSGTSLIAAARFDLARAHLEKGDLGAATEQIYPVLRDTAGSFRTVPVVNRARDIRQLLASEVAAASEPVLAIKDHLDEFCSSPAEAPPELSLTTE